MKILNRYIYKKLTAYLLVIFPSFTIVSGFVELIEVLRKVKDIDISMTLMYVLSKIPENSYYIIPISLLVSVFVVIVDLKKSRELYPIITGGIPVVYLNIRLMVASFVVSLVQVFNLEVVMPKTVPFSQQIYEKMKNQSEDNHKTIAYNIWLKLSNDVFVYFEVYDTGSKSGRGLILTQFGEDLRPTVRLEAKEFYIKENKLFVENYRKIDVKSLNDVRIETSENKIEVLTEINENDLNNLIKQKKPVSLTQIYKIANVAQRYGYEPNYYWAKLFQKLTTVISPFVLLMFSLWFFWQKEYHKVFIGFISVLIYWYGVAVISSVVETGKLPYLIILGVDFVFIAAGIFFLNRKSFYVD